MEIRSGPIIIKLPYFFRRRVGMSDNNKAMLQIGVSAVFSIVLSSRLAWMFIDYSLDVLADNLFGDVALGLRGVWVAGGVLRWWDGHAGGRCKGCEGGSPGLPGRPAGPKKTPRAQNHDQGPRAQSLTNKRTQEGRKQQSETNSDNNRPHFLQDQLC